MDHIIAKPGTGQLGRGDGACGQKHEDIALAYFADQRNEGERFADTCGMEPDERATGALRAGVSETF